MWFVVLIGGTLLFALGIEVKRRRRSNDWHVPGIDPGERPGEDKNYTMGGGRDSGGGSGQLYEVQSETFWTFFIFSSKWKRIC